MRRRQMPPLVVPTYTYIPQTHTIYMGTGLAGYQSQKNIEFNVPEAPKNYLTAREVVLAGMAEIAMDNSLCDRLYDVLPDTLQRFDFNVRRELDINADTDRTGVRFKHEDGTPVVLYENSKDFPSESLIGKLTLLLL